VSATTRCLRRSADGSLDESCEAGCPSWSMQPRMCLCTATGVHKLTLGWEGGLFRTVVDQGLLTGGSRFCKPLHHGLLSTHPRGVDIRRVTVPAPGPQAPPPSSHCGLGCVYWIRVLMHHRRTPPPHGLTPRMMPFILLYGTGGGEYEWNRKGDRQ